MDRKKAKKSKDPKKIKCFCCNRKGYFKSNCKEYLDYLVKTDRGMELFVVEACLVEESIDNWVIDSGATNHVCVSLQQFSETRSLRDRGILLQIGDESYVSAEAIGE
ncbi:hypothetical protein Gogos_012528, partial [Gossypium gossypioides]|nr:hypothetical protein [Gossypium gossypioides]